MQQFKYLLFTAFISFFFYKVSFCDTNPFQNSLVHVEAEQEYFLAMINHEHNRHQAIIKAKRIAEEQTRIKLAQEKERIRLEKIAKAKTLAKKKRLAALAAKRECARKKALAIKRKRNRIVAKVDISQQRMKVYKGGKLLHKWKVSTGRKGFNTPTGIFQPTMLEKLHLSKQYHNAPMPYSVFFHDGIAVHGTKSVRHLGHRASHGCIRVKTTHAKQLYALVQKSGRDNSYIEIYK